MSPKLHHTLKNLFRIFLILFGNALYSLAVVAFILPSGIITGGTTGLALASARTGSTRRSQRSYCASMS